MLEPRSRTRERAIPHPSLRVHYIDLPTIKAKAPASQGGLWVQSVRVSLDAAPEKVGREQQEQRQQGLQQGQDHLDENPRPLPQGAVARR